MLRIVASEQAEQDLLKLDLDALVRQGARRMLLAALKAEVDEYVADHADHRDEAGRAQRRPEALLLAVGAGVVTGPGAGDGGSGRTACSAAGGTCSEDGVDGGSVIRGLCRGPRGRR
jgi:hypothetical protein